MVKNNNLLNNGGNIAGATNATLLVTNVQDSDDGSYSVIVTKCSGSTTSANAVLTVFDAPTITVQPVGVTNNATSTVTFTVATAANSTPPLIYHWFMNNTNLLSDGGGIVGSERQR